MARVKIEDLKPEAKKLDAKEMKKLFGGWDQTESIPRLGPSSLITQPGTISISNSALINSAPGAITSIGSSTYKE
jgi:hypothetical protein